MRDVSQWMTLDHILYVKASIRLTQIGYSMVNWHKFQLPLTLSQMMHKQQIVWKTWYAILGKRVFDKFMLYYEKLEIDLKMPLYLGCTSFTQLSTVLGLVILKARFGWSDKSFTDLLVLLKTMLPKDNMLPKSHYEAKKILCPVGMEY